MIKSRSNHDQIVVKPRSKPGQTWIKPRPCRLFTSQLLRVRARPRSNGGQPLVIRRSNGGQTAVKRRLNRLVEARLGRAQTARGRLAVKTWPNRGQNVVKPVDRAVLRQPAYTARRVAAARAPAFPAPCDSFVCQPSVALLLLFICLIIIYPSPAKPTAGLGPVLDPFIYHICIFVYLFISLLFAYFSAAKPSAGLGPPLLASASPLMAPRVVVVNLQI